MSVGIPAPAKQLTIIAMALAAAERSYHEGEWEFFDEC
jgi:hypothetical protein